MSENVIPLPLAAPNAEPETGHTDDLASGVREQVQLALKSGLSQAKLAKEVGISPAALSQYLSGTYQGSVSAVESKLANWLSSRKGRDQAGAALEAAPDFVETPTAKQYMTVFAYAQQANDMASVVGSPGTGKTRAATAYREQNPNVWVATMNPSTAGVVPALQEVAEAVGLRDTNVGARALTRAIIKAVRDSGGLIVIDEAQHLDLKAIEQLRAIHDATEIGLVFVGNEFFRDRLASAGRATQFAQINSRFGMKCARTRPVKGDVVALCTAWGVSDQTIIDALIEHAARPGALRGVTKALKQARIRAAADGTDLSLALVQKIILQLGQAA